MSRRERPSAGGAAHRARPAGGRSCRSSGVFGAHGDLLLLVPIAAGLTVGPERGAIAGFVAGLAVDLLVTTPFGLTALTLQPRRLRASAPSSPACCGRARCRCRSSPAVAGRRARHRRSGPSPPPSSARRACSTATSARIVARRVGRRRRPRAARPAGGAVGRGDPAAPSPAHEADGGGRLMRADTPRLRLGMLGIVAVSLFAALFARLWYLQVLGVARLPGAGHRQPAPRDHRTGARVAASSTATAWCSSTTACRSS